MKGRGLFSPSGAARPATGVRDVGTLHFPSAVLPALATLDVEDHLLIVAWEIARLEDGFSALEQEELLLLTLASLVSVREGSTRLPLRGAQVRWLSTFLERLGVPSLATRACEVLARARVTVGQPGEFKPLILDGDHLYHQRLLALEGRLATALRGRMQAARTLWDRERAWQALQQVMSSPPRGHGTPFGLTSEQQEAILAPFNWPLSVITGGPGTGKTSIVVSILRVLDCLGLPMERVALAAPTGKAAQRMKDAMMSQLTATAPREPTTLHRLLGASSDGRRFRHHENHPLAQDVVIVDECSMIDLALMERLVRALSPTTHLVLLGDADQLPSVEPGAVFRDLVASRRGAGVHLRKSFRMDESREEGRNIYEVAMAIRDGHAELPIAPRREARDVAFRKVEHLDGGPSERVAFLERWWDEWISGIHGVSEEHAEELLRHYERARVLCLWRAESHDTSVGSVNAFFHARMGRNHGSTRASGFLPGEPVIMQRNDYVRGIMNGDQGVVIRARTAGGRRAMAVFRRGNELALFPLESLEGDIALSYAMTVHKSQGSEFEHVALLLPDEDIALLCRESVYTAVTRARASVVIVGKKELLRLGIERKVERFSGLGERLSGPPSSMTL